MVQISSFYLFITLDLDQEFRARSDALKNLEETICEPLNRFYKDKGGKDDYYLNIGSVISDLLEKSIEHFAEDEYAIQEYIERQDTDIEDWVSPKKDVA